MRVLPNVLQPASELAILGFLALYTRIGKEDIRHNRDNIAERLSFVGRVIHGTNPRVWLKEMTHYLRGKD